MTTIDSHNKIEFNTAQKFNNIKTRHAFIETYFRNDKVLDWNYSFKKVRLNSVKDKVASRKIMTSVVDRENSYNKKDLTSIDVNKIDMRQKTLSIIIFILIATGITLTMLAITGTKEAPKELGIIIY